MRAKNDRIALVTGATGFVGRALIRTLPSYGWTVVAASRRPPITSGKDPAGIAWRACDLLREETLPAALDGAKVAYYLVHSMGGGRADFAALERRAAENFVRAAEGSSLERIVYLGGPAPRGRPSEHLQSRLQVGEILRSGRVQTIELRASMIIGAGGASWQIVRDLALRLPVMVLPRWLRSKTRPVALHDVVKALAAAADVELEGSAWFDLPGPEVLSGREILERIAAVKGRRIPAVEVPVLTPRLSALWLKLVTRTDFSLARELVIGLREDLLPEDDRFFSLIGHERRLSFDEAVRLALATEAPPGTARETAGWLEEKVVNLAGPGLRRGA